MTVQSSMFGEATSEDTNNATSSPASAAGRTRSSLRDGKGSAGPEVAPASPSPWQEQEKARLTSGTYGPLFDGLSKSAALQSSLESRLRARLDVHGSPEYVLTWKSWGMPVGPPICALRASQRRTSGKGFTGWPTPAANEYEQDPEKMLARRAELKEKYGNNGFGLTLGMLVSGWPTTTTMDHIEREGLRPSRTATGRTGGYIAEVLAGWNTPRATDGSNGGPNQSGGALPHDAALSGWATPTTRDHKDGSSEGSVPVNGLLGRMVWSSNAETESTGVSRLNPSFSLWLMGFPVSWVVAGIRSAPESKRK